MQATNVSAPFTSPREKRLWLLAGSWLALVYASLDFVRAPATFLRGQNLLRLTVAVALLSSAAAVVVFLARRRPGRREWLALAAIGFVYLVVVAYATERHEERIHFLEYGIFGGLVYAALLERRDKLASRGGPDSRSGPPGRWPAPTAVLVNGVAGWGDEGIQALLPSRVYELRDVALNFGGGVLVVASMALLAWARRRDG